MVSSIGVVLDSISHLSAFDDQMTGSNISSEDLVLSCDEQELRDSLILIRSAEPQEFGQSSGIHGHLGGADIVFVPLEGGVSAKISAILKRLNAICLNTRRIAISTDLSIYARICASITRSDLRGEVGQQIVTLVRQR